MKKEKLSSKLLSDLTVFAKYAKYDKKKKRRETWEELVYRNRNMHLDKYPNLRKEIMDVYENYVITKKVLPSMRSLQFGGKPIESNNARIYNCCYLPIDSHIAFSETMFLLLSGTGVGYSVQSSHVDQLKEITVPTKSRKFVIEDSIMGWADAVKALMKAYFEGASLPRYDFSSIREKGAELLTAGGKAPGPKPLKTCLFNLQTILERKKQGEKLSTLEAHDMMCFIADAVLSGGIRRAALISLFDIDDEEMLSCKVGSWWESNPQRGRANNSAVILRHKITEDEFVKLWKKIEASGSGEPGFYLTNNKDWGSNPCCFTGETQLKTKEGWKSFQELSNQDNILLYNKNGDIHKGSVWSTGVKEVIELRLSNGDKIRCTPDHRFLIDGQEVEAKDLKGKRLTTFGDIRNENDIFVNYGYIQGDGATSRLESKAHKGLEVFIGDKDYDVSELFGVTFSEKQRSYYVNGYNDDLRNIGMSSSLLPKRQLPEGFQSFSRKQKLSFIRGLYSANGSVISSGKRVALKSTCNTLLKQVSLFLEEEGIKTYITTNKSKSVKFDNGSYVCKESYDLNISKHDSIKIFAEKIGFVHKYKTESLVNILNNSSPKVMSIATVGKEEVYDFNIEDDTHWGVIRGQNSNSQGYIAHNCEIALRPNQFCNLVEINASDVETQEELNARAKAATFLGTLQAGYTDFHYLRPIWKKTTEKDALIGVGMTGIASGGVLKLDLTEASDVVKEENERVAKLIGINKAARTNCVKPSGTTSLVLGSSSGIHAWHSEYYIRNIRFGKDEAIYKYLAQNNPELVEDEFFRPEKQAVIGIPVKAPEGAITRDSETAIEFLERVKMVSNKWVKPGHRKGDNTHNVSATVTIRPNEWEEVGKWMWENRDSYNGLSVLPHSEHSYIQPPFKDCTKEEYEEKLSKIGNIDLTKVVEEVDNTDLSGEAACAGGKCEI